VHPAQTTVNQGDTHTHLPEGMVTLEATVTAPVINVDVPPAQVVVQSPPKVAMQQIHKRDADGNLIETISKPL
jgi:hypothetical protein